MDRCPQCINEWDGAQCSFCGYEKGNERTVTGALPSGTQVGNRYTLGNALSSSRQSIGYAAWDTKMNTRVLIEEFYPQAIVSRGTDGRVNPRKNKEQFARARALFLDAPLEGTRPIKCSHSFDALNTAMRVYPLDEHHDALTRMEELLDAPIFFRDSAGNPVMTINALLIPSLPKAREYEPSSSLGKRKKRRTLIMALISLVTLVIIGVSAWAAYTLNHEYTVLLSLNAIYSPAQAWSLVRKADQVTIPIDLKQVADEDAGAVVKIGLRRGDYALDIAQDGRSIAGTSFTVDRSDPSPIILLTHSPVPTAIPTPSPSPSPSPSPTQAPDPSQTPATTPSPSPEPTRLPPTPPPGMLIYKDSEGKALSVVKGETPKPAQEYVFAGEDLYQVSIKVDVEPALFDGLFLKHEETGYELKKLSDKKENTLELPPGTYQLNMRVKGKDFSPRIGSGRFVVAAGMDEPLKVQYEFDDKELALYSDYMAEVFELGDFIYAVDKTVYKETTPNEDNNIWTTEDGVRIAMKNDMNSTVDRTLVPVQIELGIPREIYGNLFDRYEFIIRNKNDRMTINLKLKDLSNNLSMLPGEYTIEKVESKNGTVDLWNNAKVPFVVSTPDKSFIDLGIRYQDVLRMTKTFVVKQDDKAAIYPETNDLNDEQIKDLLSQASVALTLYELSPLSPLWPDDLDKEMENEYISVYINENKIGKTKKIHLSEGTYEITIRDESAEAGSGEDAEVKSQTLKIPFEADDDRFVIDETKLRRILENNRRNLASPDWMFELDMEYYKVISDSKAGFPVPTTVKSNPATYSKFLTEREKQGDKKWIYITVLINYTALEQHPEDTMLRIVPFKTSNSPSMTMTKLSFGEIPIKREFQTPDESPMPSHDASPGSVPPNKSDTAKGDASQPTNESLAKLGDQKITIYGPIELDSLDLALLDKNGTRGIDTTLTFTEVIETINVSAIDLRKAVKDLIPGIPDNQKFSLKAKDEQAKDEQAKDEQAKDEQAKDEQAKDNKTIGSELTWPLDEGALSNYVLLPAGDYYFEYETQGSGKTETMTVDVKVDNGAMTLSQE